VALNGIQKAAMLLMSLDAVSAAELLKGVEPEVVQELAVELAYLDAAGLCNSRQSTEVAHQFYNLLQAQANEGFHLKSFLNTMLKNAVGDEKAEQIQTQIQNLLQKKDPFISIRSADSQTLASVLEDEHPQAVAVVLSELPARKSSEVLGLLEENIRLGAVSRMTDSASVTVEAKRRIAEMICKRLKDLTGEIDSIGARGEQPLRKVAVILRNLGKELRDGLLAAMQEKDNEIGEKIVNLMVLWEDIPQVVDRSLQKALRGIDSAKLALALVKADAAIIKKIKSNISERAAEAIDEETSLMSAPKKDDIAQARKEIVKTLCEMNEKGELDFIEE